eukprot:CAMPEP_0197448360 /NCGR_PEP_ID=MMETSP1175-20131217/17166_1 /TAXON_ID=1003142 /ORGANISM="Triceratium dubium, Strain CCMP147" /LENGTH=277 /DNA_ID=CAMNT_0042980073 /DNA_START=84 /DNA_END=917 /DNA_ORIENTATION=+
MLAFERSNLTPAPVHLLLVAQQEWEAVRKVLSTKKGLQKIREEMSMIGVESPLHFACRFLPPLDVISRIANAFPESVTQVDSAGRYPMHIAAKWGAATHVVRFLAEERPDVAGLQDSSGKTPLHHLCLSYSKNYNPDKNGGIPVKLAFLEISKGLCMASPSTVNLEDKEGMTALEYAIISDVNLKAIRSIQRACEKDWKERRIQAPGGSHDVVAKNLLVESQMNSERLSKELMEVSQSAMDKSMSLLKAGNSKLPSMLGPLPSLKPRKASRSRAMAA